METLMSCALNVGGPAMPSHQQSSNVAARYATQGRFQAGQWDQQWQRSRSSRQVDLGVSWYGFIPTHVLLCIYLHVGQHAWGLVLMLQLWTLLTCFAGLAVAQGCSACSILPLLQGSWHR